MAQLSQVTSILFAARRGPDRVPAASRTLANGGARFLYRDHSRQVSPVGNPAPLITQSWSCAFLPNMVGWATHWTRAAWLDCVTTYIPAVVTHIEKLRSANPLGWTHSRLGEIWISNERMRYYSVWSGVARRLRQSPIGGQSPISSRETARVVVNVIVAVWRIYRKVYSYFLLYKFLLFCETYDLLCEIMGVSEKRMTSCIVKIIYNV